MSCAILVVMDYSSAKKYFQRAYRTGSDFWTLMPYKLKGRDLLRYLPAGSMLLDVGSGRGRFPLELARLGYKVIGLDYVKKIVTDNNEEVRVNDMASSLRFVEGNALDIPFTDASFDGVLDFGLMQHFYPTDRMTYVREINRVLKPGGYTLLVLLSRETTSYLTWTPKAHADAEYDYEDVHYHFFTPEEIMELFGEEYALMSKRIEYIEGRESLAYLVMLLRKK